MSLTLPITYYTLLSFGFTTQKITNIYFGKENIEINRYALMFTRKMNRDRKNYLLQVVTVNPQIPQGISSSFLTTCMCLLCFPYVFLNSIIKKNSSAQYKLCKRELLSKKTMYFSIPLLRIVLYNINCVCRNY